MREGFFDKLRKKDEAYRKRFALSVSFLFTAVVFASWLLIFLNQQPVNENNKRATASSFSSFKRGLDNLMESGVQQYDSIKQKFENQFKSEFQREENFNREEASTSSKEVIE